MEFNNVNPISENVVALDLKFFTISFLKIIEIEFKMKLKSFIV